jgi:arylsulfatase A-like enzyme/acetyl esterase/lipase
MKNKLQRMKSSFNFRITVAMKYLLHAVLFALYYVVFTGFLTLEAIAQDAPVYDASVPKPTLSNISYGKHERHILDFWKAESNSPTPLVFVVHGGGWRGGEKERVHRFANVQQLLDAGISVVAINYRLMKHIDVGEVIPPVKAPLYDAARALQFVRSKSKEWNIDKERIGAAGGSAGACTSLWLAYHDDLANPKSKDPVARESTRLWSAAVMGAQTTLDPKQMKEWTPNSKYGGHAFGKENFEQFLAERESILPWIAEYSPYALTSTDDPPVYLLYNTPPALGQNQKDPTHTANFGAKLEERCKQVGIGCELNYPDAPNVRYERPTDYLIASLNGTTNSSLTKGSPKRPNVLIILADDLGWGDIGYNNPDNVYTPNLDKLSKEGTTFTQHYVMPQCTPTRVAAFTGRYPGRFGVNGLQATNEKVFPIGTPNLANMFSAEGYRTHICGKWHMGSDISNGPNHHGFDESYGSLAGAVGMYDHRYRTGNYENAWHRNHQSIDGNEDGIHATDLIATEVQNIIKTDSDEPFFVFTTFHAPHTPLDERGKFIDRPTQLDPLDSNRWLDEDNIIWFNDPEGKIQNEPDPEKRLLLATVNHLDHAIGEIIKTLDESGKRENTIILFSSDNGPQVNWNGKAYPDDLHLTDFNQPIPMKGSKLDVWEGGIHVPGFINWPGKVKAKKVNDPVHIIDWLPTLANLIGHQQANEYKLDGVDLEPILFNDESLKSRDLYWIWNPKTNRWALRYEDWKIVKYGTDQPQKPTDWQLFNLKKDKKETTDLGSKNSKKLSQLHELFLAQRAKDIF